MAKLFKSIIEKFNPYHDAKGRFSTANGAASFTYAPGKSKAHDLAIARAKTRMAAEDAKAAEEKKKKEERREAIRGRLREKGVWGDDGPLVIESDPKTVVALGREVAKEIDAHFKARKKAGLTEEYDDEPTTDDIYGVLRDIRDFGCPEEFRSSIKVNSGINEEDTKTIIDGALNRYPSDWYDAAMVDTGYNPDFLINIHDSSGRANFSYNPYSYYDKGLTINVFRKEHPDVVRDLRLDNDTVPNAGVENTLVHELGHYFEHTVRSVDIGAQTFYEKRTKNCETTHMHNGELTKADKFADEYMGRVYANGMTEITSVLAQKLGYASPVSCIKSGFFSTKKDHESYYYIIGMMAGGGWKQK